MDRRAILLGSGVVLLLPFRAGAQGTPEATPGADGWAQPGWLVQPDAFDPGQWHVVMFGTAKQYLDGRIGPAEHLDWTDLDLEKTDPDSVAAWADATAQVLLGHGILLNNPVAIVDYGTLFAARLFWVLTYLGATDQTVLDGGLPAWSAAGGTVESGPIMIDYGPITADLPARNETVLAPIDAVVAAVDAATAQIIDVRSSDEYAQGHIPGAINVPYLDNSTDGIGGAYKDPAALWEMYEAAGVDLDQPIIPYCTTGVRSAVTWFVLSALGAADVRLFSGSWREWTSDPARPIQR